MWLLATLKTFANSAFVMIHNKNKEGKGKG